MKSVTEISGKFKVVKSTSDNLIGFKYDGIIKKNEKILLNKDNASKILSIGMIVEIEYNKYHIINSNISVMIKKY